MNESKDGTTTPLSHSFSLVLPAAVAVPDSG